MSRNLAASIRARLKNHADTTRQDFNLVLTHFGLERQRAKRNIGKGGQLLVAGLEAQVLRIKRDGGASCAPKLLK